MKINKKLRKKGPKNYKTILKINTNHIFGGPGDGGRFGDLAIFTQESKTSGQHGRLAMRCSTGTRRTGLPDVLWSSRAEATALPRNEDREEPANPGRGTNFTAT